MMQTKVRVGVGGVLFGLACLAGFSSSVAAAATEAGQVSVASSLIDEIAQSALPARVDLPHVLADVAFAGARTATLAELRYCGTGENGAGRFRAVVLQNNVGKTQSLLSIPASCQLSLGELAIPAASLVGPGQSLAVADVEAVFQARELKLGLVRAVLVHGDATKRVPETFDKRLELASLPPSALRFELEGFAISLREAPAFGNRSVGLVVAVSDGGAETGALSERGSSKPSTPLEAQATLAVEVPLTTLNVLLRRRTAGSPITIALQGDEIDLRNISVQSVGRGAATKVTATGSATPRSIRETVQWTVNLAGDPLLVSSVRAVAQLEDCAGQGALAGIACDLRNGGRSTAAEAFAATLTNRYGGQAVHVLASPIDARFSVAGRSIHLSGDLLRVGGGRAGLAAAGNVSAVVEP
jgi:hypothetical protein